MNGREREEGDEDESSVGKGIKGGECVEGNARKGTRRE